MISPYVLVKLFEKATYERHIRNLGESGERSRSTSQNKFYEMKCRVCLKEGVLPIYNDNNSLDISVAVSIFGDIEINKHDEYPKHLCDNCHNLLQGALLFRNTAKKSDQILRKVLIKKEPYSGNFQEFCSKNKQQVKIKQKSTLLETYFTAVISDSELISEDKEQVPLKSNKKVSKVQCQICFKIITKAYYKEHFALHDPSISKYMCDVCGKSFRQRCTYRNHYFTHSTEFPYKCKLCPYRGRNSGLLKTHIRTHTGDYRYMCSECPARFLTISNLNKHSLKHKEPTFKCDTCHRAFHSKLILERHFEADHLGIKNHICSNCGKAFGYRKAMMRHQLDVHKREKKLNGRTPSYLEVELCKPQDNV